MIKISGLFLAALAASLFPDAAGAGDNTLLALGTPVKSVGAAASTELKGASTDTARAGGMGYTDFDAFSAVNDPLYREGAKELLKEVYKKGNAAAENTGGKAAALRDAPISRQAADLGGAVKPHPVMKKPRAKKPVPADPLKIKSTL